MNKYPKWRRRNYPNEETARNQLLLGDLLTYEFTLQELSDKYDITRERVRQIHFRATGIPYRGRIQKYKDKLIEKALNKQFETRFNCRHCQKPVPRMESHARQFFCGDCQILAVNRDLLHPKICILCYIIYYPIRARVNEQKYCTPICWGRSRRGKPRKKGLTNVA